jgi:hypothetical protein
MTKRNDRLTLRRLERAAMRLKDWPDTSYAGLLRRHGFHDVADAIARIQTAIAAHKRGRKHG